MADSKLERDYQAHLIKTIEKTVLPGCIVLKNDSSYRQGIPDLVVFFGRRYAMLEVKRKEPRPGSNDYEPNQEWYIDLFRDWAFGACIFPENEEEVLSELQQALRPRRKARVPVA